MASSRRLSLFPDLNDPMIEATSSPGQSAPASASASAPAPFLSFPSISVEQLMAAQSDIEATSYTLKSCVETMTAVSNLARRLQNRTFEVHQVSTQLSVLQRMYRDARGEICVLKSKNKELQRQVTSLVRIRDPSYAEFDGRRGKDPVKSEGFQGDAQKEDKKK